MIDLTREQVEDLCADTCPHCKAKVPLSIHLGEWIHTKVSAGQTGANNHSITICMATHLRDTYKDILNG